MCIGLPRRGEAQIQSESLPAGGCSSLFASPFVLRLIARSANSISSLSRSGYETLRICPSPFRYEHVMERAPSGEIFSKHLMNSSAVNGYPLASNSLFLQFFSSEKRLSADSKEWRISSEGMPPSIIRGADESLSLITTKLCSRSRNAQVSETTKSAGISRMIVWRLFIFLATSVVEQRSGSGVTQQPVCE